jgi:hypothetical protein
VKVSLYFNGTQLKELLDETYLHNLVKNFLLHFLRGKKGMEDQGRKFGDKFRWEIFIENAKTEKESRVERQIDESTRH